MKSICWALLGAATTLLCCPAEATAQRKVSRGRGLATNFAKGPAVGKSLPDVGGFDADGKPFKLSRLKGSHAVIVFGCLT